MVILSSDQMRQEFKIEIDRRVSPDSVKIYDAIENDLNLQTINVISMRDQDIFIDTIDQEKWEADIKYE